MNAMTIGKVIGDLQMIRDSARHRAVKAYDADECQYVKVNSRTKEGKNRKLNWLCCAGCLKEYKLGSVKQ